jgi:hypothetical protein
LVHQSRQLRPQRPYSASNAGLEGQPSLGLIGNLLLAAMAAADKSTVDGSRPFGFVLTCLSLAVGSAAAVWAGSNMLRVRNYWVAVAGAIAVMPGSCLCVVTGVPIGIWALVVLFKQGVREGFT